MSSEKKHIYEHSNKAKIEEFHPKPFIERQEVTLATGEKKKINNWVLCGLDREEYQWWKKDSYSLADTLKVAGADEEKFSASVERPTWANGLDIPTISLPTCRDCPYSHFETYSKVSCGCNVYPGKYDGSRFACHRFVNSFGELKSTFEEFEKMRVQKVEKEKTLSEAVEHRERERLEKEKSERGLLHEKISCNLDRLRSASSVEELKSIWMSIDFSEIDSQTQGTFIEVKDRKKEELSSQITKSPPLQPRKRTEKKRGIAPPRRRK